MHGPTYNERRIRSPDLSKAGEAKPSMSTSSLPKPYPVSIRAYRKKDYEYLMKFPHAIHSSLRPLSDAEHSLAQRDGERLSSSSSSSLTRSSIDLGTSSSFASSVGGYDMCSSPDIMNTQANIDSARDFPISPMEAEGERHGKISEVEEECDILGDAGDLLAPMEGTFAEVERPQNLSTKSRRRGHKIWNVFSKAFVAG